MNLNSMNQFIESEVLNVRRLNRRNKDLVTQDNNPKWIPSRSVVIIFSGQNLPNEIFIHKVRIKVESYQMYKYEMTIFFPKKPR